MNCEGATAWMNSPYDCTCHKMQAPELVGKQKLLRRLHATRAKVRVMGDAGRSAWLVRFSTESASSTSVCL